MSIRAQARSVTEPFLVAESVAGARSFRPFEYHGKEVPVLIEVKTTPYTTNRLSWQPAYRDTLVRYADMLRLPLLIAWRVGTFWTLIDVNQLQPSSRYKIEFFDAMKNSLMTELAGTSHFRCELVQVYT